MPEPSMGTVPNRRRRYQPKFEVLATVRTGGGAGPVTNGTVGFRALIPDSRVRARIDLLFSPTNGVPFGGAPTTTSIQATATILGYVKDDSGSGAAGLLPTTKIWGTPTTPANVITDDGLYGLSLTEISAIDVVQGFFILNNVAFFLGTWYVGMTIQPFAVTIPDDEWEKICADCKVEIIGQPLVLG